MNLDDFLVAENIATPAGAANSPSPELAKRGEDKPTRSHITAIPIKHRQASLPHFVPQSVPVPAHAPNVQHEFGYITRHHRKTSIDERRVSNSIISRAATRALPILLRPDSVWSVNVPIVTDKFPDSQAAS